MHSSVERWLHTFMCTQYAQIFEAYGYRTLQAVCHLQLPHLLAMGVPRNHSEKILENVHILRQTMFGRIPKPYSSDFRHYNPSLPPAASSVLKSVVMNSNYRGVNQYPEDYSGYGQTGNSMHSLGYHQSGYDNANLGIMTHAGTGNYQMLGYETSHNHMMMQAQTQAPPAHSGMYTQTHQQQTYFAQQQQYYAHTSAGSTVAGSNDAGVGGVGSNQYGGQYAMQGGASMQGIGGSASAGYYSTGAVQGGNSGALNHVSPTSGLVPPPPHHHLRNSSGQQNPQQVADNILQMASSYPSQHTVQVPLKTRPAPYQIPRSPHYSYTAEKAMSQQSGMCGPQVMNSQQTSGGQSSMCGQQCHAMTRQQTVTTQQVMDQLAGVNSQSGGMNQQGGIMYQQSPPHNQIPSCTSPMSPLMMHSPSHSHQTQGLSSPSSMHSSSSASVRSPIPSPNMNGLRSPCTMGMSGGSLPMRSPVHLHSGFSVQQMNSPPHRVYSSSDLPSITQQQQHTPTSMHSPVSHCGSPYAPICSAQISSPTHPPPYTVATSSPYRVSDSCQGPGGSAQGQSGHNQHSQSMNPLQSLQKLVMLPETQVIDPKSVVNDACMSGTGSSHSSSDEGSKNCEGPAGQSGEAADCSAGDSVASSPLGTSVRVGSSDFGKSTESDTVSFNEKSEAKNNNSGDVIQEAVISSQTPDLITSQSNSEVCNLSKKIISETNTQKTSGKLDTKATNSDSSKLSTSLSTELCLVSPSNNQKATAEVNKHSSLSQSSITATTPKKNKARLFATVPKASSELHTEMSITSTESVNLSLLNQNQQNCVSPSSELIISEPAIHSGSAAAEICKSPKVTSSKVKKRSSKCNGILKPLDKTTSAHTLNLKNGFDSVSLDKQVATVNLKIEKSQSNKIPVGKSSYIPSNKDKRSNDLTNNSKDNSTHKLFADDNFHISKQIDLSTNRCNNTQSESIENSTISTKLKLANGLDDKHLNGNASEHELLNHTRILRKNHKLTSNCVSQGLSCLDLHKKTSLSKCRPRQAMLESVTVPSNGPCLITAVQSNILHTHSTLSGMVESEPLLLREDVKSDPNDLIVKENVTHSFSSICCASFQHSNGIEEGGFFNVSGSENEDFDLSDGLDFGYDSPPCEMTCDDSWKSESDEKQKLNNNKDECLDHSSDKECSAPNKGSSSSCSTKLNSGTGGTTTRSCTGSISKRKVEEQTSGSSKRTKKISGDNKNNSVSLAHTSQTETNPGENIIVGDRSLGGKEKSNSTSAIKGKNCRRSPVVVLTKPLNNSGKKKRVRKRRTLGGSSRISFKRRSSVVAFRRKRAVQRGKDGRFLPTTGFKSLPAAESRISATLLPSPSTLLINPLAEVEIKEKNSDDKLFIDFHHRGGCDISSFSPKEVKSDPDKLQIKLETVNPVESLGIIHHSADKTSVHNSTHSLSKPVTEALLSEFPVKSESEPLSKKGKPKRPEIRRRRRRTLKNYRKNKKKAMDVKLFDTSYDDSFKTMKLSRTLRIMQNKKKKSDPVQTSSGQFTPFIRVEGKKEQPSSVIVINHPLKDAIDFKTANKKTTLGNIAPTTSVQLTHFPSDKTVMLPSTKTTDSPWLCALCSKRSSYRFLGDLFGPYYLESHLTALNKLTVETGKKDAKRGNSGISVELASENKVVQRRSIVSRRTSNGDNGDGVGVPHEVWVHEDCTMWSNGVYLVGSRLFGLEEALKAATSTMCAYCRETGAMVGCLLKGCNQNFHFVCAVDKASELERKIAFSSAILKQESQAYKGCFLDIENFSMLCPKHKDKRTKNTTATATAT